MPKKITTVKRQPKVPKSWTPRVGERVRFKTWDEMEAQYGRNSWGSIDVPGAFTEEMRHLCGKSAVVTSQEGEYLTLKDHRGRRISDYVFSSEMIRPSRLLTAAERKRLDAAEAKARAEAEAAAAKAKAKAERDDKLAGLSDYQRSVVAAVKAGSWGCQKRSVIGLVSALALFDVGPFLD